jgi:hypothetical protein
MTVYRKPGFSYTTLRERICRRSLGSCVQVLWFEAGSKVDKLPKSATFLALVAKYPGCVCLACFVDKGNGLPVTCREGTEGESRYSSNHSESPR